MPLIESEKKELGKILKEKNSLLKQMNLKLEDLNKLLIKEQKKLIGNNEKIIKIENDIKEHKEYINQTKSELSIIRSSLSSYRNFKKQNEIYITRYLNSPYSQYEFNHFKRNVEKYYLLNNSLYYINIENDKNKYNDEQIKLLLKEFVYKENSKFDKLRKQIELYEKINLQTENNRKREPIPEDIRFEIWRRDEGKCVICGSKENLEFDHIIPFSKGGGNTVRNLQLLCESCNRKKSDKI
jgi:hypothetical protein